MDAEITIKEFRELVEESCKYRAIKEYVERCDNLINDEVIRAMLGIRKEDNDV